MKPPHTKGKTKHTNVRTRGTYNALLPTKAGNLVLKTPITFLSTPVITPGLDNSFTTSHATSLGGFLSSLRAKGNGIVEIRDFRNEGVESKRDERCAFERSRKEVRSV